MIAPPKRYGQCYYKQHFLNLSKSRALTQGYALIATLMFMLTLTLIALAMMHLNTTQIKISTNDADSTVAFQTAEGALNQALNNVLAGNYPFSSFSQNTNGLYIYNPNNPALWTTIAWSGSSVIAGFQGSAKNPAVFFIEQLPSVIQPGQNIKRPTQVYRITARSSGASGSTSCILQATVQTQQ